MTVPPSHWIQGYTRLDVRQLEFVRSESIPGAPIRHVRGAKGAIRPRTKARDCGGAFITERARLGGDMQENAVGKAQGG